MNKVLHKRRTLTIKLAAWLVFSWLMPTICFAQDVYGTPPAQKSSFTGSIKQGFSKVGTMFSPKTNQNTISEDDPTSLKNKSKPSAELYSAIAKWYDEQGKTAEAEQYFQMALKEKADDLTSLLGYAKFQENQGRIKEALALYQKAVQTHPREPSAYNNLGLCFARRGKLNEATQALSQAAQLEPRNPLYRNNLATVLVDQNRLAEAFANLRDVHGDAKAYYNMGYLLQKKGKIEAAEHDFAQALRIDPTMVAAQKWLAYLNDQSRQSDMGTKQKEGSVRVGSNTSAWKFPAKISTQQTQPQPVTTKPFSINPAPQTMAVRNTPSRMPAPMIQNPAASSEMDSMPTIIPSQTDDPPLPPSTSSPQRLPPVSLRQPASSLEQSGRSSISDDFNQAAPLPPIN